MRRTPTYLDTSVISVYAADKHASGDSVIKRKTDTQAFWAEAAHSATLITSNLAHVEGLRGDPRQSRRRKNVLRSVRVLHEPVEGRALAARFAHALGRSADDFDLRHLAAAIVHGAHLFVTWDIKSVSERTMVSVDAISRRQGFDLIDVITPSAALDVLSRKPRTNPIIKTTHRIPAYIRKEVARIRRVRKTLMREERERDRRLWSTDH